MIVACKISPKGDRDEMHSLQLDVKNEIYENNKTKGNVDSEKFDHYAICLITINNGPLVAIISNKTSVVPC